MGMNINQKPLVNSATGRQLISNRYRLIPKSYLKLNKAQEKTRRAVLNKIKDGTYQLTERICQLCGGDEFIIIAERDRYSLPVRTVFCKSCSLLMTNPVMRQADYADFYQNHYTSLYDGFQYSTDEFFENQNAAGKRLHETVKQHVNLDEKIVAEVGCAAGGILHYFKDYCKNVVGCDFGTEFMKFGQAKGLKLKVGGLECLSGESPDVIIYSHVLEHIFDINKELDDIYKILPKKGLLIIDVPGVYNIDKAYGADFLRYLQNAHLFHFNAHTLSQIMAAHGFRTVFVDERCIGVFEKVERKAKVKISKHDDQEVLRYLNKIEGLYFWYKVKAYPRKLMVNILKFFGIFHSIRSGYRKLKA
jgi:SAM-dependent methyltransferase